MKKKNKGFTLIELLVVVAVIGILAAVIIVAMNNARKRAADARIKLNVNQIKKVIELAGSDTNFNYYTAVDNCYMDNNPATPDCTDSAWYSVNDNRQQIKTLMEDIQRQGSNRAAVGTNINRTGAYGVFALLTDSTHYFCLDSTGLAGVTPTNPTNTSAGPPAPSDRPFCPTDVK